MKNVNYIKSFEGSIIAIGNGNDFIAIEKLETPFKRADGKRVSYQLDYRRLSDKCENENDESWCTVLEQEFTYYSAEELKTSKIFVNRKNPISEDWKISENFLIL